MLKKLGVFSICALMLLTVCVGCGKDKENNEGGGSGNSGGNKPIEATANLNSGVISTQIVDGFKLQNASLTSKGNDSTFIVFLTNSNSEPVKVSQLKVSMKDENDSEVFSTNLNVDKVLEVNESIERAVVISKNLMNVKRIDYQIIR